MIAGLAFVQACVPSTWGPLNKSLLGKYYPLRKEPGAGGTIRGERESSDLSLQLLHVSSVLQLLGLQLHHEGKHLFPPALQQGLALPAELGLQGI